jgi:hypothetical protein
MLPLDLQLPDEPFAFSLQALVDKLQTVKDLCPWGRIFGTALDPCILDQVVGQFFRELCCASIRKKRRRRGGLVLTIDGKTLRGTIALGSTRGVHLVCAYLPQIGVVLAQVEVQEKANELVVAPTFSPNLT